MSAVRHRRYSAVFNRNLAREPGFESGTLTPADTSGGIGNNGGNWSISTSNQRNGSFCAVYDPAGQVGPATLVANGALDNSTFQPAASPGESFSFEFWTRAASDTTVNGVNAEILFVNAAGSVVDTITSTPAVFPGTTYEQVSITGTAPADTAHVAFRHLVRNNGRDNDIFIDDRLAKRVIV